MREIVDRKYCNGCECCRNVCPQEAIEMIGDGKGFLYPHIDENKCIECKKCLQHCTVLNYYTPDCEKEFEAYAGYYNGLERKYSTSGGMAYILARKFLQEIGGSVYGVRFSIDFDVEYICITDVEALLQLCGSKYVQCRIGETFKKIKKQLEQDENILFIGLPCQIVGLKNFLECEYSKLYTVDLLCMGISSNEMWKRYLEEYHNPRNVVSIEFKNKENGWKYWQTKIVEDKRSLYYKKGSNPYMKSFISKLNIRSSCFYCDIKGTNRVSDITIGDAWGIAEYDMEINDDKGLSSILINSEKGRSLFEKIKMDLVYKEYPKADLVEGNWATFSCPIQPKEYDLFWNDYSELTIHDLFQKYQLEDV